MVRLARGGRSAWRMPGYRVEELLGAGSSGEVWRGRVSATGVPVALKRIWLSDREQRQAALSEAALLSTLDHPHLMRLHEVRHVDDDAIVLVLDLAAAGSLGVLLARRGRLTVGETITAVAPIAAALAYAHNAGVVHGDVSAANVLFTDIGLPLLADLGVARLMGDAAPVRTTPAYADPLVAAGSLPTAASDVFMLGGVALHALTGDPPWSGADPAAVFEEAANGEQPDFAGRLAAAGVPDEVRAVVARALDIDPGARGTAADLALDLRHAGQPVAVELRAGRALQPITADGARPMSARVGSWPLEPAPAGPPADADGPGEPPGFVGEQPLTYGVRAPFPFADGAARHLAGGRPRVARGLLAGVAALAALAAVVVTARSWWPAGGDSGAAAAPAPTTAGSPGPARPAETSAGRAPRPGGGAPQPGGGASLPGSTSPGRPDAATLQAALATLDARRARAFARRDPRLLSGVYASPTLLARDRALLTSIVPPGCGLRGVHTRFSDLRRVTRSPGGATVTLRAAVAPSVLVCGATRTGRAPGTAPTVMVVSLAGGAEGYRIVAEHTRRSA